MVNTIITHAELLRGIRKVLDEINDDESVITEIQRALDKSDAPEIAEPD